MLMMVSIAPAGCADKKQIEVKSVGGQRGWLRPADSKSNAVLRHENIRLRDELRKVRTTQGPEALLARLDALEEDVLRTIYELGYATTSKRADLESAEAAIDAQRVTIEVLQTLCRLYEDAMSSQRTTIEILKKMCRLYQEEAIGS